MELDLETRSKEYFHNLNPLAQKFARDLENTQEAYQGLWNTLTKDEQNQVLDENIITPAAVLKYASVHVPVLEENPLTYSWFTKSQLDLFTSFKPAEITAKKTASQLPQRASVVQDVSKEICNETKKKENRNSFPSKLQIHKSSVLKPKSPPPPPPAKLAVASTVEQNVSESSNEANCMSTDMPKTGFDFLDNW